MIEEKKILMEKLKKKDEMEKQLEEMMEDLKEIEKKGYGGKLTDNEGFPKPDIEFGEL